MRFALPFALSVTISASLAACGAATDTPCTLTAIGAQCVSDTDCCSGYCQLYDVAAYCQTKPKSTQACVGASAFCTQDRNCCSGLCENGSCFAGGGGTSCLSVGSTCIAADSCCTNDCINDGQGHQACAEQPQSDGGSCGLPGTACTAPGEEDTTCCFGVCGSNSFCIGGGGGGGSNCGQSGAFCRYGSDCCDGQCEKLSSTSACH